jgi:SAM-dependent methyltransferase
VAYVLEELALGPGSAVVDLGAGTGKLTRMLTERGLDVTAVDPSPAMLAELRLAVPDARTVEGTAEAIPLDATSVEAVTAGQAFHWFDARLALAEAHRILRPAGGLALLWNRRDMSDPVQAVLDELTDPPERTTSRGWKTDVPAIVAASGRFSAVATAEFTHTQPTDETRLLSRLRSSSYVAGLPAERRRELERRLESELDRLGPVTGIRFTTIVYTARRFG